MKTLLVKKLFLFLMVGSLGWSAISQTVISGIVTDESGSILPGASVYLHGTYEGTTTDAQGRYSLKTSKSGEFTFMVTYVGFKPFTQQLVLNGAPLTIPVQLEELFNRLKAATIMASTFEAGDRKQAVKLSSRDMVTTAGAAGDIYGALQSLPGTSTIGESGRLFVKGGDSNESKTFIDGSLVYVPYNSTAPNVANRGRFNPYMFRGTIFSTGGYSAEYGQALSSVLILNTNDMPVRNELNLSASTAGAELAGTRLWKNGAVTGTLSYINLQPYYHIVPQNFDWVQAPETGSGAISVRQKTGKRGLFKLYSSISSSGSTITQADLDSGGALTDYALVNRNNFVNLSWKSPVSEKWTVNSGASFTRNKDDVKFGGNAFSKKLTGAHVKNLLTHQFSEKVSLKFGAEFFSKSFTLDYQSFSDTLAIGFINNTLAGFAETELYASAKFVARMGARAEYSDYLKRTTFSPRISAAWKFDQSSQISLAYGWFNQDPSDEYLAYTDKLNVERADHYILSYQLAKDSRTLRAEIFYKDYRKLVKLNGPEIYYPANYSNNGSGYAYGFDLFWRDNETIKNGDYWISYSYIDTKRNYRNYPVEAIPEYSSRHNLAIVYKHWINSLRSYVGANYKYSSPRYYQDPNSRVFNGARTLPYNSADLSWSFLYRQNVVIHASVTNVFGFKQGFGYRFASSPGEDGVYQSAAIAPASKRFIVVACFISLTKKNETNQYNTID